MRLAKDIAKRSNDDAKRMLGMFWLQVKPEFTYQLALGFLVQRVGMLDENCSDTRIVEVQRAAIEELRKLVLP